MKLLNLCIGKVQTIQIGNESVRTAHVKSPVAEPSIVTSEGAEVDERAVHPDKIYAYAYSFYKLFSATPAHSTELERADVHFCRSGVTCAWRGHETSRSWNSRSEKASPFQADVVWARVSPAGPRC
jgi:hypothetical protein